MKNKNTKNMAGELNLHFYLEDTNEAEMDEIFDDIASEIENILMDFEIFSNFDYQITQESYEVNNRLEAAMGLEKQENAKTFSEGIKEATTTFKRFILGTVPKRLKN